jgi:hypothetical protein
MRDRELQRRRHVRRVDVEIAAVDQLSGRRRLRTSDGCGHGDRQEHQGQKRQRPGYFAFAAVRSWSRRGQFAALSVSGECVPSFAGASKGLRNIGSNGGRQAARFTLHSLLEAAG